MILQTLAIEVGSLYLACMYSLWAFKKLKKSLHFNSALARNARVTLLFLSLTANVHPRLRFD